MQRVSHPAWEKTLLEGVTPVPDIAWWEADENLPNAVDPLLGSRLDIYEIDTLLGKGGMGRVYLAYHRDLQRPCALKILSPRLSVDDHDYIERFLNEGRAAASLVHPNIVTIHSIGQAQDLYYLEMEFVPGRSLRQLVEDEGRLNTIRATEIAARIAAGLAAAHRSGIVHRDLKPDNVLLTVTGVPKIVDFGLAKKVRSKSATSQAEGRSLCGTPLYMAPELFLGTEATPASDIYALGITYYRMLCGTFPFAGNTLAELMNTVTSTPLPNIRQVIPDLSLEVAEVLGLLLDKSASNRPQTGMQAVQLLQAILGEARDIEVLLQEAFRDDSRVDWVSADNQYLLTVALPEERRQKVCIESSHHGVAERLLQISSLCCAAKPAYYEQALRLNSEMPHGGIGVQDIDGEPQFLVLDTYPRATVVAEEIRRSVHEVASRADAIEKLLTGRDRN